MRGNHGMQRAILPTVVFITGACILIVEVLATRVLAPYFGTTIYTVSSVIGVVLGALSVGYYAGGRIADARPSPTIFYSLIAAGGISVFILEALLIFVLPAVGYRLPLISGPLIASLALFFIPSVLLGCLSPFAIRLQQEAFPALGIGTLSGEIFFWSTIGSIAGSLASGFLLIPYFGIHTILVVVGGILVILGMMGILKSRPTKKGMRGVIMVLTVSLIIPPTLSKSADLLAQPFVYLDDGLYERIAIYDTTYAGHPSRVLEQDRSSSSAMFLDSPELAFAYTKYYALASLLVPDIRHTLVLGAGAYSVPKALLADYPRAIVDVVDIEPSLYDLSKKFFGVSDDPRLIVHTTDARRFLLSPPRQYDLIFSDIYSSLYSLPVHASTREFFRDIKHSLKPDGVFIANVIGSLSRHAPSITFSLMRTLQSEFDNTAFFAVSDPADRGVQNIIFVGINGTKMIDGSSPGIRNHTNPVIRSLASHTIDPSRYDLSWYPVFTDRHAPVEHATRQLFSLMKEKSGFSGKEGIELIRQQLTFGPRFVGSPGHEQMEGFLKRELTAFANEIVVRQWDHATRTGERRILSNYIARFNPGQEDRVILATHYDTNPTPPTPGANNGASGVAVLLEIARVLALRDDLAIGVDLIFFDGEEGEEGVGTDTWRPLGSEYFAANLKEFYPKKKPLRAWVIDMVCEKGADIQDRTHDIHDDHTALNAGGIPSTLFIDFDYPYNYSLQDTIDKCNAKSLQSVGDALLAHIKEGG